MASHVDRHKKQPTIGDVAKAAGVSIVSASRVINNYPSVRESTRKSVRRAMLELGYSPNAAAQMLRTKRSNIIGCVVTDLSNHATAAIVHAAEQELHRCGMLLVTASSDLDDRREAQLIDTMRQRGVDGLLLQPSDERSAVTNDAISRAAVPVVLLDRDMEAATDRVLYEHYESMREVVRYLFDLGHRDIAIIATEEATRPCRERVRAFVDEYKAHGLTAPQDRILCGSHLAQHGFDATMSLMSAPSRPTALIAAGNLIVLGAIRALQSMRIRIPTDLSFVGADSIFSEILDPPMTAIERDMSALGQQAARLLTQRLNSEQHRGLEKMTLPSRVLLRRSCAPIRKGG